jgi:hypothetical protein
MATNSVNDYLVCRYLQSGNWVGSFRMAKVLQQQQP